MDHATLYDAHVADHYDALTYELLLPGRQAAMEQITRHCHGRTIRRLVDLSVGTGESLLPFRDAFPEAELIGVDISHRMIEIASTKFSLRAIHDDALNVGQHVEAGSVDLVLAHYMTSYLDASKLIAVAAIVLGRGRLLSLIGSTYDSMPNIARFALEFVSKETLHSLHRALESDEALAGVVRDAGLEIHAHEEVAVPISFASLEQMEDWGRRSGFMTHILERADPEILARARARSGAHFPINDHYQVAVILASRP